MAKLKKAPLPITDKQPEEHALPPRPHRPNRLKKYAFHLMLLAAVGAAAYGLWKNPQSMEGIRAHFAPKQDVFTPQISQLRAQIAQLTDELHKTNFKIENSGFSEVKEQMRKLEQINLNIIHSKADASAVLGVVTRVDSAEQKIAHLSAVTDTSALILTGVLLVKDAADRGQTFEYEAEVLNQLAAEKPQTLNRVKKIQSFAASGIPSDIELAAEFEELAALASTPKEEADDKSWKERLNNKLGEIVQIKKADAPVVENKAELDITTARKLVHDNEILRASNWLGKSTSPEIIANQNIQNWIKKVNTREEFYQAISALSADSLASLKVNNLQKVRSMKK